MLRKGVAGGQHTEKVSVRGTTCLGGEWPGDNMMRRGVAGRRVIMLRRVMAGGGDNMLRSRAVGGRG
jgi:hypothetical protein